MDIVQTTADKIGVVVGAVTAAGIVTHAISTNIRKRKLIKEGIETSAKPSEKKGGA